MKKSLGCLISETLEPLLAALLNKNFDCIQGNGLSLAVYSGGSGIVNRGNLTVISGHIGTSGTVSVISGFHDSATRFAETEGNSGFVSGSIHLGTANASRKSPSMDDAADMRVLAAFNVLAALPCGTVVPTGDLGGLAPDPGVYGSASGSFSIVGSDLILDAKGNADAAWVFQMANSLTVGSQAASQSVVLLNGAQPKNVYWQVGRSARINEAGGGIMVGTIVACAGIVFSTPGNRSTTTLYGRAIALFASVLMTNAVIDVRGMPFAEIGRGTDVLKATAAKKTILLVEDQFIISKLEATILEDGGYEVLIVGTGEDAIRAIEEKPGIDLVFMDIDLGRGIDGLQAAETILSKRDLPLIFLSSHTESDVIGRAERITPYGYLVKGPKKIDLVASIEKALGAFENRKGKNPEADSLIKHPGTKAPD